MRNGCISAVWPTPYARAQRYQPGSGSMTQPSRTKQLAMTQPRSQGFSFLKGENPANEVGPWLPLPEWYGCAHVWGIGHTAEMRRVTNAFIWFVITRMVLTYYIFSTIHSRNLYRPWLCADGISSTFYVSVWFQPARPFLAATAFYINLIGIIKFGG